MNIKATNKQLLTELNDINLAEFMFRAIRFYFEDVEALADWLGSTQRTYDDSLVPTITKTTQEN